MRLGFEECSAKGLIALDVSSITGLKSFKNENRISTVIHFSVYFLNILKLSTIFIDRVKFIKKLQSSCVSKHFKVTSIYSSKL